MWTLLGVVVGLLVLARFLQQQGVTVPFIPSPMPILPGVVMGKTIDAWAKAIAEFEGFYTAGSVAARNNNPGNLKVDGDEGRDARGFGIFSTIEKGWAALTADLAAKVRKYPDFSVLQIMTRYLGGNPSAPIKTGEGDPFAYARFVAGKLGVTINDTLGRIFGG